MRVLQLAVPMSILKPECFTTSFLEIFLELEACLCFRNHVRVMSYSIFEY